MEMKRKIDYIVEKNRNSIYTIYNKMLILSI